MTFAPQSMSAALSGAAAAAAGAMDLTHLCWSDETKEMVRVALASGRIPLVRQALKQLESHPQRQQFPEFKLAVLRSFTIEPQLDFVSLSLSTIPSRPTLKVGDFANFETLLWNPASDILAFAPHAVLVLWRLEDLYPDLIESCASWPSEKREQAANMVVERINALCNGYCKVSSAPIFISTMPDMAEHQLSDLHRPWSLKSIKS